LSISGHAARDTVSARRFFLSIEQKRSRAILILLKLGVLRLNLVVGELYCCTASSETEKTTMLQVLACVCLICTGFMACGILKQARHSTGTVD
jgi:hypothetical protein